MRSLNNKILKGQQQLGVQDLWGCRFLKREGSHRCRNWWKKRQIKRRKFVWIFSRGLLSHSSLSINNNHNSLSIKLLLNATKIQLKRNSNLLVQDSWDTSQPRKIQISMIENWTRNSKPINSQDPWWVNKYDLEAPQRKPSKNSSRSAPKRKSSINGYPSKNSWMTSS